MVLTDFTHKKSYAKCLRTLHWKANFFEPKLLITPASLGRQINSEVKSPSIRESDRSAIDLIEI